jgi:16S rRNA G1207 methylase RsmC
MSTLTSDEERAKLRASLASPPEIEVDVGPRTLHLVSAWGLFSARGIDEGTALLLKEVVAMPPPSTVLDLGCGYGAIGLTLAALWPDATVVCVDKDLLAVETTQANIERNDLSNATAVLSPGFRDAPEGPYNVIVSNLPAQAGNEAIDQLLLEAYEHLAEDGSLIVVTVVGLKRYIKRRLQELFGNYHKVKQGARHIVSETYRAPTDHSTTGPAQP